MIKQRVSIFVLLFILNIGVFVQSCRRHEKSSVTESYDYPDTLKVGTLYSPMSYFQYKDEPMGYDYSLVGKLAEDKAVAFELVIAPSVISLIEMLDSGLIDIAAYDVPITGETIEHIVPCGYEHITQQVLVQKKGKGRINDVTELIDKDIYVEKGSKYYHRLINLNEELGGGINIHTVEEDSIISEDLLDRVSDGSIPLTVVDSDVAKYNKAYYPDLDTELEVSFPQRSSWAVSKNKPWLADSINDWFSSTAPREENRRLLRRYFELSKGNHIDTKLFGKNFSRGYISQYDSNFRQYAEKIGWDWKLLAAMGFAESKFDNTVTSWAGAKGIMQVMPSTARAFGYSENDIIVPEKSIALASEIIASLDKSLTPYVEDPQERKKFVIGAYNSGLAHILDAITIAKAYGYDPRLWEGNVAVALKMKSQPEIYNNSELCRFGYCKGSYTVAYVNNVMNLYDKALSRFSSNN